MNWTEIKVNHGDRVVCDGCNKDFTNSAESGGIYGMGTKAYGPCCAPEILRLAEQYCELRYVKSRCPEGMPFADWVRTELR